MIYNKICTKEEIIEIMKDPILTEFIKNKLKDAKIEIDSHTFQPYKVVDLIRYDLEPIMDLEIKNGK